MIVTKKELIKCLRDIMSGNNLFKYAYVQKYGRRWHFDYSIELIERLYNTPWIMHFYYIKENLTFSETERFFDKEFGKTPARFYFNDNAHVIYEYAKNSYEYFGMYKDFDIIDSMTYNKKFLTVIDELGEEYK